MAGRSKLGTLTIAQLQREIRRREHDAGRKVQSLQKRRDNLLGKIAELESQIAKLGGRNRSGVRTRPQNDANLADSLAAVLKNTIMNVTGVSSAVQKAGYRTTSPNFRTIVNQTLIKDPRFKRVSRGKYTVK
ncbi:MAG: hypothetical protein JNK58_07025 [Phycisphaerae bacterium]|nr:hypothetical protein [Phycisphaerae bacterium]